MEKFNLPHTALYAKNWYKRTELWDDLRKILTADGFYGESMTKEDIMTVISNHCFRINNYQFETPNFINSMIPQYTWKFGYSHDKTMMYPEENEYNYMEAVVRYCLSGLSFTERTELPKMKPDYNILPKNVIENGLSEEIFNQ